MGGETFVEAALATGAAAAPNVAMTLTCRF
jgi:hypothetical protein